MAEVSQETINALRALRTWAKGGYVSGTDAAKAVDVLDNAGVFAAIDTATDYDLDAVASTMPVAGEPDPAEWGDTTAADMAAHQGLTREEFRTIQDVNRGADYGRDPAPGEGFTQDQARALFGDTEPDADGRF
jgi:hypothetical protein